MAVRWIAAICMNAMVWMAGQAHAAECNPPQRMCGDDPYTYLCPPCPPHRLNDSAVAAERYRQALEGYRQQMDDTLKAGDTPFPAYKAAIGKYHDGITDYKSAIDNATRGTEG